MHGGAVMVVARDAKNPINATSDEFVATLAG
jgi:hypothetical protein